jgi:hypothetical protein
MAISLLSIAEPDRLVDYILFFNTSKRRGIMCYNVYYQVP